MKTLIYVCISLIFSSQIFAQSAKEEAIRFYNGENYDSASYYVNLALAEDGATNIHQLLKLKGDILSYQNQLIASIDLYQQAIWSIEKMEILDFELVGECYVNMSWCYQQLGLLQEGLIAQRKAKKYIEVVNNPQKLATLYANFGSLFVKMGIYDSASYYFEQAQKIDIALSDSSAISSDLNSLGFLHQEIGEYQKAINYYQQSITYLDSVNDVRKYAVRLNNIGMSELRLGAYDLAELHVSQSRDIELAVRDTFMAAKRLLNLGEIQLSKGNATLAVEYQLKGIKYFKQKGAVSLTAIGLNAISETYLELNNEKQAMASLLEALQIAEENGLMKQAIKSLKLQNELYRKLGRLPEAYEALTHFHQLTDSLHSSSHLREIKNLEINYIVEKNIKEVKLLTLSNELAAEINAKNRILLFLLIGIVIALVLISATIIYYQRQKAQLKAELLSKEIDELRFQINAFIKGKPDDLEFSFDHINANLNDPLSKREFEVLELALSDKNNREIAETVFLSVNTIKFHLKRIYEKLGVSNRKEALQFVIKSK